MPSANEWFRSALDGLSAAVQLAEHESWRSACSRGYYAAHNAAHAILSHFDQAVASQNRSIPHGELPGKLFRTLRNRGVRSDIAADQLRLRLVESYNIRIQSDYKPQVSVDAAAFGSARAPARELVELARRLGI